MRIIVVDDHPVYRDGLLAALEAIGSVDVVGIAGDGDEAVRLAIELEPDLVLMDLAMPGCNGIEATRRILAERPAIAVLVLTMLEGQDSVTAAVRAGARGYLVKGADRAEIASAINAVSHGQAVFGDGVAASVLERLADPPKPRGGSSTFPQLTEREVEILGLLGQGMSNVGMARRLFLSEKTVRNYVSNVLTKLNLPSREAAAELARASSCS